MVFVIAAVSENNVIGQKGRIPWNIKEDLNHFKELTSGNAIVMGRRTFESIGRPLPDRLNIVVSNTVDEIPGAVVVRSLDEAVEAAESEGYDDVFVCGGQRLYEEAVPFCDRLYITRVHENYEGDCFFPEFDPDDYIITEESTVSSNPSYSFITYERKDMYL